MCIRDRPHTAHDDLRQAGTCRQQYGGVTEYLQVESAVYIQGGQETQHDPAQIAQIQLQQLQLPALRLALAHIQSLHNAQPRIFTEVVESEAVAVVGDDAGDHKKHGPQANEKVHDKVQGDDLAGKREAVEQRAVDVYKRQGHCCFWNFPRRWRLRRWASWY